MCDLPLFLNPRQTWRIYHRRVVRNLAHVELQAGESQEQLLKRFRKQVAKDGILSTVRRKRWYVSKSELRRIQKKKAVRRARRKQRKAKNSY